MPAILLAFGVGAAIGNYAGGQIADRFGATRTVVVATLAMIAITATASVLPGLPRSLAAEAILGYMFVWGLVAWTFLPAQASRVITMAADAAPLALSFNGSALYLGVALASVVGGEVLTYATPADLGVVGALFPLLALGVIGLARPAPLLAEARLG